MNVLSILAVDPAVSPHWLFPEPAEIIYGGLASLIVFFALYKLGLPAAKKGMAARTEKIQKELDSAANDLASATGEAEQIRQAKGDIEAERRRLLGDAEVQASALLEDGRTRLAAEIADLEAKAEAEAAGMVTRVNDEVHAEIARIAAQVIDRVAVRTIDSSAQNDLVESFIAKVGASS
jgi:F-type H+-transporting ATPase subunit b